MLEPAFLVDPTLCLPAPFEAAENQGVRQANGLPARAARRAGAVTWSFEEQVCPDGECCAVRDGRLVWRDPLQISADTSRALVPAATDYLRDALATSGGWIGVTVGSGMRRIASRRMP